MQGTNDFRRVGYGGPCPPPETHRYFFKLYALDVTLELPSTATQGHVLAQADLMGTYARR